MSDRIPRTTAALTVMVLALVTLAPAATAQENDGPAAGSERLIENPDLQGDNEPTVQERYPGSSYILPHLPKDEDWMDVGGKVENASEGMTNRVAQILMASAANWTNMTISVVQWAFDARATGWLTEQIASLVEGLHDTIWGPLALVMVLLGGLWTAWHALVRRRASYGLQGVAWMVAAIAISTLFVAQPRFFLEGMDNIASGMGNAIFAGLSGVALDGSGGEYYGEHPPTYEGNTSSERARRHVADNLWRILVFKPWTVGTFHSQESADRWGEELLADPSQDTQEDIRDEMKQEYGEDSKEVAYFSGHHPGTRISVASLAVIASLITGIVTMLIGAGVLLLQLAGLLLTLVAPLFFLIGIHPGQGRNALLRWADTWGGVFVKRVLLTAVLAGLVAVNGLIIENVVRLSWFLATLLMVLTGVAVIVYRKTFVSMLMLNLEASSGETGASLHSQRSRSGSTAFRVARKAGIAKVAHAMGRRQRHGTGAAGGAGDVSPGGQPGGSAGTGPSAGATTRGRGRRTPTGDDRDRSRSGPTVTGPGHRADDRTRSETDRERQQGSSDHSETPGLVNRGMARRNRTTGQVTLSRQGRRRLDTLRTKRQGQAQPDGKSPASSAPASRRGPTKPASSNGSPAGRRSEPVTNRTPPGGDQLSLRRTQRGSPEAPRVTDRTPPGGDQLQPRRRREQADERWTPEARRARRDAFWARPRDQQGSTGPATPRRQRPEEPKRAEHDREAERRRQERARQERAEQRRQQRRRRDDNE